MHLSNVGGEGGASDEGSRGEIFRPRLVTMEESTLFENFETLGRDAGSRLRVGGVGDTFVTSGCRKPRLPLSRDYEGACRDVAGRGDEGRDRDGGDAAAAVVGSADAGKIFRTTVAKKLKPAAED